MKTLYGAFQLVVFAQTGFCPQWSVVNHHLAILSDIWHKKLQICTLASVSAVMVGGLTRTQPISCVMNS